MCTDYGFELKEVRKSALGYPYIIVMTLLKNKLTTSSSSMKGSFMVDDLPVADSVSSILSSSSSDPPNPSLMGMVK